MTRLYKFIADPDAVAFILRGSIKFTPIHELNDPSELTPNVISDEVTASLNRLRKDGYTDEDMAHLRRQEELMQRLAPQFQAVRVPRTKEEATAIIRSSFYDRLGALESLLNETALTMSSKVGVFCTSLRYDSLPMWAHYASNASGLVVEFIDLEKIFHGDSTGILGQPISVRYERDRLGVTFDTRSHESLFFTKFADWSYEQEVRIVLPLTDCRKELFGNKPLYTFSIPRQSMARIILGWNMADDIKQTVKASVASYNPKVEVIAARIVRGRIVAKASTQQDQQANTG